MTENSIWKKAQTVELKVSENILPEFNIGFDKRIPIDVEQELRSFVTWVENNYRIPITLWVDFEYNHYLISRSGKRVGYLFYWSDFSSYPVFDNEDDIPRIKKAEIDVFLEHSCFFDDPTIEPPELTQDWEIVLAGTNKRVLEVLECTRTQDK